MVPWDASTPTLEDVRNDGIWQPPIFRTGSLFTAFWKRVSMTPCRTFTEDTLVCVGLRRIVTVSFFAPCTDTLTYLLTYLLALYFCFILLKMQLSGPSLLQPMHSA